MILKIETINYDELDFNGRGRIIKEEEVTSLMSNISEIGLIQPVVIDQNNFLICGYRRLKAHMFLGLDEIDVVQRHYESQADRRLANASENLERDDLTRSEEAVQLRYLRREGLAILEIAQKLSRSKEWVGVRTMLLRLPDNLIHLTNGLTDNKIRKANKQKHDGHMVQNIQTMLKGNRLRGETKKPKKRLRNKTEMIKMQAFIRSEIGNGLETRILAWAFGEITDQELKKDIENEKKES